MKKLLIFLPLVFSMFSCAGSYADVKAGHSNYPISMNELLLSEDLSPTKAYTVIKDFNFTIYQFGILGGKIPFGSEHDISEQINKLVKDAGGNAVVNLKVEGAHGITNYPVFLTGGLLMAIGPMAALGTDKPEVRTAGWTMAAVGCLLPGYITVKVSGQIVKLGDS